MAREASLSSDQGTTSSQRSASGGPHLGDHFHSSFMNTQARGMSGEQPNCHLVSAFESIRAQWNALGIALRHFESLLAEHIKKQSSESKVSNAIYMHSC
jgi:hypothetical protein